MFSWYKEYRRASEVKQLNRDAPLIVTHATDLFKPSILTEIACQVRDHVDRIHVQYGTSLIDLKRAHSDYKRMHKEARHRADQTVLSSMTLTIIYIRAEIVGPGADQARHDIEAFVNFYADNQHA
jgi:hypothetical protein|tara:strand:- start:1347 stop:1721 length:375 start_codon:yes stop_codon:yes gene_type:complete